MVDINTEKILNTSIQERRERSAAFLTLLKVKKNEHKSRDPKKAELLKSFEDKRRGFKIGNI